jgi:UDP-N-acetylmuramoyl-tripeptide--D-alanyl-D-alanine ligase
MKPLEANMPTPPLSIAVKEMLPPVDGTLVSGIPDAVLTGVSTDSRTLQPGELFWALTGETFDGHDFVTKAVDKGAAAVMVARAWVDSQRSKAALGAIRDSRPETAVISVDDTLKALGDLAAWWRHRHAVRVVGITGSSGKTSTKEMTAAILQLGRRTLKNPGNFNNLIGLPVTLLGLDGSYAYAVLEMGMNRPGEIARLTEIADPDVGVILNVGMAHLEGVSDLDGVARAKTEMMAQLSSDGLMIVNGDDAPLMKQALRFRTRMITFGLGEANDVRATGIHDLGPEGIRFTLIYREDSWPVHVKAPGRHHIKNALAAAAAALSLGVSVENIVRGLASFTAVRGRFEVIPLGRGILLVDDTYNANPSSLGAAIESAASLVSAGGRLIVGLGDMLELGDAAVQAHREAGRRLAEGGATRLFIMGEYASDVAEGARTAAMPGESLTIARSHDDMVAEIIRAVSEGDLILLKGSRRMHLEKVVEGLRRWGGARPEAGCRGQVGRGWDG